MVIKLVVGNTIEAVENLLKVSNVDNGDVMGVLAKFAPDKVEEEEEEEVVVVVVVVVVIGVVVAAAADGDNGVVVVDAAAAAVNDAVIVVNVVEIFATFGTGGEDVGLGAGYANREVPFVLRHFFLFLSAAANGAAVALAVGDGADDEVAGDGADEELGEEAVDELKSGAGIHSRPRIMLNSSFCLY